MVRVLCVVFCLGVSGCAVLDRVQGNTSTPAVEAAAGVTSDAQVRPQARPGTSVPAAAAPAPEVSIGTLGRTVASLGNAAEPGLWLKTPLVQTEQPGTVYYPQTNKSVQVTLIPIDGPATAGSRLSLQAMQALGAPLTGLPEVDVLAG
ncbi:hypothetical protein [uncultured Tateyamaria sp.]|uniref:hypothetical protein n=1 Tax=Tateyamaria sp. 1078 TaxID=3417464 RepID=UPI002610C297|nr:hypothetical protein [uncultured Tateyamaria sp.]